MTIIIRSPELKRTVPQSELSIYDEDMFTLYTKSDGTLEYELAEKRDRVLIVSKPIEGSKPIKPGMIVELSLQGAYSDHTCTNCGRAIPAWTRHWQMIRSSEEREDGIFMGWFCTHACLTGFYDDVAR